MLGIVVVVGGVVVVVVALAVVVLDAIVVVVAVVDIAVAPVVGNGAHLAGTAVPPQPIVKVPFSAQTPGGN